MQELACGRRRCRTAALTPAQRHKVLAHLRARLTETVGLRELAAVAHLSPSHFCRAFKASTGLSPHRWQLNERILAAQEAMRRPSGSLAEIALAGGFSDQAHFTNVFTRTVGMSPAAWRRRQGVQSLS